MTREQYQTLITKCDKIIKDMEIVKENISFFFAHYNDTPYTEAVVKEAEQIIRNYEVTNGD